MSHAPALVFDSVRRSFGRRVALDHVSLDLAPGSILGHVGRNGAGKTTALRLAHGMLFPDAGQVRVLGLDPVEQGLEVRRRVSLLSEESSLYPWMRVGEILEFGAALHSGWDPALAKELVGRLSLDLTPKIQTLSRGTKAQVALVLTKRWPPTSCPGTTSDRIAVRARLPDVQRSNVQLMSFFLQIWHSVTSGRSDLGYSSG